MFRFFRLQTEGIATTLYRRRCELLTRTINIIELLSIMVASSSYNTSARRFFQGWQCGTNIPQ